MTDNFDNITEAATDLLTRVWIKLDLDAINDIFSDDAKFYGVAGPDPIGRTDYCELASQVFELMRLKDFTLLEVITADGLRGAVRVRFHMTTQASGRTAVQDATIYMTLRDGKICEFDYHFDFLQYFTSVEQLPPDAAYLLLSGQSLG
ncbi:MAG: nuclear transport factor 2 family protein [Pelagimonas sp.]|jgi:ketosteroid isomerase-like protein|nr:nuclear transport factor 2 family protein [Pelagimonas sp.]